MKLIISTIFSFILGLSAVFAQQNNTQAQDKITKVPALNKAEQDSLARDKKNGTIYSSVNKEGVIEISKKEFAKIPAERQEVLRKDKNYKIIEDK
jgi:hypothetical protein